MGTRLVIIVLILALGSFAYLGRTLMRNRAAVRRCQEVEIHADTATPAACLMRGRTAH